MYREVRRGYVENDKKEFSMEQQEILKKAAAEIYYLINRGYSIKSVSTFVGNHYLLSERQRLMLVRAISSQEDIILREKKKINVYNLKGKKLNIDGFNTVITLEVCLSQSTIIKGMDGTIRDLAGLRGTYNIVDKTEAAVNLLFKSMEELGVNEACIYLDSPVSNSGRLKDFIMNVSQKYSVLTNAETIPDVDSRLEKLENVVTSDAIILNRCISWINLNEYIIENNINNSLIVDVTK